jgi:hypothetical protein
MFGKSRKIIAPPSRSFSPACPPVPIVRDSTPPKALVSLDKTAHVSLIKKADAVGAALAARGLDGARFNVVMLLDRSGSMADDYRSGAVQTIVERALGFALRVDDDGFVPVIAFGTQVSDPVEVHAGNYVGVIGRDIPAPGYDSTNLTGALEVAEQYAALTDRPLFVIVVADGGPDNATTAQAKLCALASYPAFVKLLAVRPVGWFSVLDDLGDAHRLIDNVDAKPEARSGLDLTRCTDEQFAEAMVDEVDTWLLAATAAGLLTP